MPEDAWISFIIRNGRLVPPRADTVLADDEVVVLASDKEQIHLRQLLGS